MKTTAYLSLVALLRAPAVLAQGTETSAESATTTSATVDCTASVIAELCEYKDPGPGFAVASDGRPFCWEYCDSHPPCSFVIFRQGNPYLDTGTCWLYPDEEFDVSLGTTGCDYLTVYDQPVCEGEEAPTPTSGDCAATETPSAIASVCEYPPPEDCFYTCSASNSVVDCLSRCAEDGSCNYVVYYAQNEGNSPYSSGTCWMYTEGEYDPDLAVECGSEPNHFVYENVCPRPSPSSVSSSATSSETEATGSEETEATGSEETEATTSESTGAARESSTEDFSPRGLSRNNLMALGMAMLVL